MCNIKDQIVTLLKQRHHSHKVALEQEKDPRSKHAIDLIARIREDSQLIELIDSLPEEDLYAEVGDTEEDYIKRSMAKVNECRKMICKDSLQVPETCKENAESFTSLEEAAEKYADGEMISGLAERAFIAGGEWRKQQMMKEAVDGKVFMSFAPGHNQMVMADVDLPTNTKVKLIIVKQDD